MEFFDSLLNLYNTNYEVRSAIQAIGFLIAFICIPELIGNHNSIESFAPAKPIVRRVVRIILSILLVVVIFTLLGLLMDNGLL
ncbi:hypothetical protein [Veillonella sp.]|jgi:hypothetical protein|uniref:hypothetical protein n=1 Tax=Veillonella sp. TaxID=1926307 RepID=UPI00189B1EB0|nr:hypothetical protein [Veillonella sp.]MDU2159787.1 hypothetical protein [Veillonella sp.]MDU2166015.1 hypothetical protein [Veillonella sp.]MDU4105620.1 hypothetical protein [Veillonella sp.]